MSHFVGWCSANKYMSRCVAVGDRDSGKTQVLSAFAGRIKLGQYIPTVFDDYTMDCTVHENNKSRTVELGLFDTAGQEDYQKLLPLTFEKADVFVICFPADASIERMKESVKRKWLREISRVCPGVPFVIVAVHNDWDDADDIPGELLSINPEKRAQFSRDVGASGYFDIWPCTRIRVDDILTEVGKPSMEKNSVDPLTDLWPESRIGCWCCCDL